MYRAHDVKPRKKWIIVYGWFLVALLIVGGAMTRFKIAWFFAFIIGMALISEKTVMVTERGLENYMDMRFTSNYELWKWDEIEALTQEKLLKYPGVTQLYFTRGDRTRKVFFLDEPAQEILKLAGRKNKKLRIYDGDFYKEEYAKRQNQKKKKR